MATQLWAQPTSCAARFPCPERLTYGVEWRLIDAGTATVDLKRDSAPNAWAFNVQIQSVGLVSRLYRVFDSYQVTTGEHFCLGKTFLDAQESKKHSVSRFSVNTTAKRMLYEDHDLVSNRTEKKELDVAACTYEIVGALAELRFTPIAPGHSSVIPLTDGKKYSPVRLTAEKEEQISVNGKTYTATRYEAFLFDNVIYKRKGRLLIWISNERDHVPVEFRLLLGFPIGTVTVSLEKRELK